MVNNIFLYKRFIGVKKINGHSGVNFSFNKWPGILKSLQSEDSFDKIQGGRSEGAKTEELPSTNKAFGAS